MAEVQSGISCFLSTEKHKPKQIHLSVLIKTPCIIKISSTQSVYNRATYESICKDSKNFISRSTQGSTRKTLIGSNAKLMVSLLFCSILGRQTLVNVKANSTNASHTATAGSDSNLKSQTQHNDLIFIPDSILGRSLCFCFESRHI